MMSIDFRPTLNHTMAVVGAVIAAVAIASPGWAGSPSSAHGVQLPIGDLTSAPTATGVAIGDDPMPYTDTIRYAGSTLRPRADNVSYTVGSQGGCLYATAGSTSTFFNLSVELPDRALIEYVRMYADDSSATANAEGYFTVYDLYGNIVDEFSMYSSGSSGPGYWTTDELAVRVDYSQYSYVLHWRPGVLGSSMQLCGFRIYYSMP